MEEIYARHGDLVLKQEPIPSGIELSKPTAPVILAGRESAPHTIHDFAKVLYGRNNEVQYLRVSEATELAHSERHKTIPLPVGDYHIASLAEMNGELSRAVED